MKLFQAVSLLLLLPAFAFSQGLITNTSSRVTTSLNGDWHYIVDPYETGYFSFHSDVYDQTNPKSPAAYYNNYHTTDKGALVEYDFDKSPVIKVPGDWNTQIDQLFYYEGTVWYKKSFDYHLNNSNRLFLYFGAINYKADVYLNGVKLGNHEGGFTPFNYEVTSIIKPTNNYLVVKVDNKRFKEAVPTMNTDWWNYGGITREVTLIEEPATFIRDYSLQLKKGDNTKIEGLVELDGLQSFSEMIIQIPELNIEQTIHISEAGRASFEINTDKIKRWSPATPFLYKVHLKTPLQTLSDNIGFRTIETRDSDILLNGIPVFLKGISIHEEYKGKRVRNKEEAKALLLWAKELGCNYVRLAHYPHNEEMVRLADEMGILVWEEIPVYWTIDFSNESTYLNAKAQLTALITRDKNRASVIVWSMANETPYSEARNIFLKKLISHAKSLDTKRLISAALLTRSENGRGIIDDEIGNSLDLISFNQYRGWYGGDLKTAPSANWTTPFLKPVIVSEFGGGALQGLHGKKEERWTEEFQVYLYQQNLLMIEKIPQLRGISPWILTDFRSPRRLLPEIQDGFNRKGLISDKGIKKKAFFTLQKFYKDYRLKTNN